MCGSGYCTIFYVDAVRRRPSPVVVVLKSWMQARRADVGVRHADTRAIHPTEAATDFHERELESRQGTHIGLTTYPWRSPPNGGATTTKELMER